jgi:hypothetical protein
MRHNIFDIEKGDKQTWADKAVRYFLIVLFGVCGR